ncbi:MAG: type II secretion system protein [Patescibacteria group bacterium]|nr:type II secretion system protein [Patescibacteria group bacterium]
MYPQLKKSGFTLIETIIYIAIVASILLSMSYLIINIVGGQSSNNSKSEVNYNVESISSLMRRDFRSAKKINSLTSDRITVEESSGQQITYTFDNLTKSISRAVESLPAQDLNTSLVAVSGQFSDLSYLTRSKNIGVALTIEYKNPDNLAEYQTSSSIEFAVELRGVK